MNRLDALLPTLLSGAGSVSYVAGKGNAGDALIAAATGQVLRALDIPVTADAPVTLVAGGGGLHPKYDCLARVLGKIPAGKRVIVLPSTVTDWAPLRKFTNLTLLARDPVTLSLGKMEGINTIACHDAAFSFDYSPWDERGAGVLHAFRTDAEALGRKVVEGNLDISLDSTGWWPLHSCDLAARKFVGRISRHRGVSTDRLHVAIAASMLGKKVALFPNNYHKNLAVFQMSLADNPNVTFHED